MKITESKIRQYIKKLLMETFYVQPDGVAMTRDQFANQRGNEGIGYSGIPDNVPQTDRSFPAKLAFEAKKEFKDFDPMMRNMYMQKLGPITFGDFYDEFLDNLTFSSSDLEYINPEVNLFLTQNKESFHQGIELMMSFLPKTAEYINHVATASDQFSAGADTAQYISPSKNLVFINELFDVFFKVPDKPGDIGMGSSLFNLVVEKILSAMVQVQGQTPSEFADLHIGEFKTHIDAMFKKNPVIAKNAQQLAPYRRAYLDSIYYVLQELIAEINFEFLYLERGPATTSMKPEDVMLFLPDDRELLNYTAKKVYDYATKRGRTVHEEFQTMLPDAFRPNNFTVEDIPELRSMPSYYETKYSLNPKLAGIASQIISNTLNYRMYDNFHFGVGYRKEGIDFDPWELELGEKWDKS